jgi:hypothetical protein
MRCTKTTKMQLQDEDISSYKTHSFCSVTSALQVLDTDRRGKVGIPSGRRNNNFVVSLSVIYLRLQPKARASITVLFSAECESRNPLLDLNGTRASLYMRATCHLWSIGAFSRPPKPLPGKITCWPRYYTISAVCVSWCIISVCQRWK